MKQRAVLPDQPASPPVRRAAAPTPRRAGALATLLALGGLLELWLLALFCVAPLRNLDFIPSPVADRWPLLVAPTRWLFAPGAVNGLLNPTRYWPDLALLAAIFCGAGLTAAAALYAAWGILRPTARHLLLVLAGALLFGVTLLFIPAFPSRDIFSYLFYGRMSVLYHANPLIAVPNQFPHDPLLARVFIGWRTVPSVYGPVWEALADGLTRLTQVWGGDLALAVLLFKGLALLFHLANAALLWRILGLLAPRRRLMGTLLYAWNPLALLEFAGSGHNDAVMLFFLLLAVLCLVQRREVLALVAFACSIDTKYITLLIVPLAFWYLLRERPGWAAKIWGALWRLALLGGVCLLLYLPYWAGLHTLAALNASAGVNDLRDSLQEIVATALRRVVLPALGWSGTDALFLSKQITKTIATLLFLVLWLRLFRRVTGWSGMLGAWWWAFYLYLVIASGWFLPWYVTWLLVVAALRPQDDLTDATQLLAVGALLFYVTDVFQSSLLHGSRALLCFGLSVGYLLWRHYQRKRVWDAAHDSLASPA